MRTVDYRTPEGRNDPVSGSLVELCLICGKPGIWVLGFGESAGQGGFAHVVEYCDEHKTGHVVLGCRLLCKGGQA
jgi:hypothetical protein